MSYLAQWAIFPLLFDMHSADVISSFWLVSLFGSQKACLHSHYSETETLVLDP